MSDVVQRGQPDPQPPLRQAPPDPAIEAARKTRSVHRVLLKTLLTNRQQQLTAARTRLRTPDLIPDSLYERAITDAGRLSGEVEMLMRALREVYV